MNDGDGFWIGIVLVAFIWLVCSWADGADVSRQTIDWAQKVCEPNGGIQAVDRENAFCANGAEFTYRSEVIE